MLRASWRELSAQEKHLLYRYLIAEGIGIEGLRELNWMLPCGRLRSVASLGRP